MVTTKTKQLELFSFCGAAALLGQLLIVALTFHDRRRRSLAAPPPERGRALPTSDHRGAARPPPAISTRTAAVVRRLPRSLGPTGHFSRSPTAAKSWFAAHICRRPSCCWASISGVLTRAARRGTINIRI